MTNAEWAAIALWCWANGTMPTGNNNWGREISDYSQTGIRGDGLAPGVASGIGRDRKSTRLNSSHIPLSRMPSSA